jgi:hypothetical protein
MPPMTLCITHPQVVEFTVKPQGENKVQAIISKVSQASRKYVLSAPSDSLSPRQLPKAAFATARSKKKKFTANQLLLALPLLTPQRLHPLARPQPSLLILLQASPKTPGTKPPGPKGCLAALHLSASTYRAIFFP